MDSDVEVAAEQADEIELIRQYIRHVLSVFPRLSASMLQIGLGTHISPTKWKPVLEDMIAKKQVHALYISKETPKGRIRTYTVLVLDEMLPEAAAAATTAADSGF